MKFLSHLHALRSLAFLAAISAFPAHAIHDTNNNGLSDLWEKQHNNGNLFPNTFLATNDEDQDGWTNAKEAIAGTDPFQANPPDGIVAITITPSLVPGAFTLSWPTLIGKNYQLKVSTDLVTWTNLGNPVTTTQNTHTIGINTTQPNNSIPSNVFWQINVTDLDTDGDGLTDAEEHALGTDPQIPDTDADGLSDRAEIRIGTNPLIRDSDGDGSSDAEEASAATDPNSNASHPPQWRSVTRTLNYDFTQMISGNLGVASGNLSVNKDWIENSEYYESVFSPEDFTQLHLHLLEHADFPNIYSSVGNHNTDLSANGTGAVVSSNYFANLSHRRVWLEIKPAPLFTVSKKYIKLTQREINGIKTQTFEVLEVEVVQGETLSEPIDLEPYFEINPTGNDEHVETVKISILPIEIVDKNNNILTKLKVSKMEPSLTIVKNQGVVQSQEMDISKDIDRCYIRIQGGAKINDIENAKIGLKSLSANQNVLDDTTNMTLSVSGEDLISRPLIFVCDDIDDDYSGPQNVNPDEALDDQTHKAEIGGTILLDALTVDDGSYSVNKIYSIPKVKSLHVDFVIFKRPNTNVQDLRNAIDNDIAGCNLAFQQIGIYIVKKSLRELDFPDNVPLQDGKLKLVTGAPIPAVLSDSVKKIIEDFGTFDNTDDLHVFYTDLELSGGIGGTDGFAINNFFEEKNPGYLNNIFMKKTDYERGLAHEIVHCVGRLGHQTAFSNIGNPNEGKQNLNIMFDYPIDNGDIFDTKRLINSQYEEIIKSFLLEEP
jgi:hypothetical protein